MYFNMLMLLIYVTITLCSLVHLSRKGKKIGVLESVLAFLHNSYLTFETLITFAVRQTECVRRAVSCIRDKLVAFESA